MRRLSPFVLCVLVTGCGAKTGLGVPEYEEDATVPPVDAPPLFDAPPPPECTVFGATAQLRPLDVFMLFDASGSMQEPTRDGSTKWRAVRRAISRFFNDPESSGIGVGLTFFPQVRTGVPVLCGGDDECGGIVACVPASGCLEAGVLCNTSTDCRVRGFPADVCTPLGFCAGLGVEAPCLPDGTFPCMPGTGPCLPLGLCEGRDTCEAEAYSRPVIGPEQLPDAAGALLRAYDDAEVSREMAGGTPTLPGLVGTVRGAMEWADANPTHEVVVVVATDGLPTSCDPDLRIELELGVANVANAAALGFEQDIQTFVVGVFGADEAAFAQVNLDRIAAAGGTEAAFVVDTGAGVSDEFLEALNQVRLDATACDFALSEPLPVTDEPAWARITRDGAEIWISQVEDEAACLGGGGFFFPEPGPVVQRIALCPETCAILGASPDRDLEIFTVCPEDPTER